MDFARHLSFEDLFENVSVYVKDKSGYVRVSDSRQGPSDQPVEIRHGVTGYKSACPSCPCEYAGDAGMTVTFEGFLYDIMNSGCRSGMLAGIEKFFEQRGLYFEQGHQWSFSVYPLR